MHRIRFGIPDGDSARIMSGLLWIGLERGYFRDEGVELDIVPDDPVVGTREGSVDVRCASTADIARWALAGFPVVVVASIEHWADGRGLTPLCARKALVDSGDLADYADLRGKRIAMEVSGGRPRAEPDWILFYHALLKGGLTFDDVTVVNAHHGEAIPMLASDAVDLAPCGRPRNVIIGENAGFLTRWRECWQVAPRQGRCVVAYRTFRDAHADAVQGLVTAWARAGRDYVNAISRGQRREDLVELLVRATGEEREVIERMSPLGADPDGAFDLDAMQRDADLWAKHGVLPARADMASMVDSSFVETARHRLQLFEREPSRSGGYP